MLKNKLLLISFLTILFIAVFHYLSIKYSWYWTFRWLDIPVHILGGFWVSLTTIWVCLKAKHIESIYDYKKKVLFLMLVSVLSIAIFWEVFELVFGVTSLEKYGYWQDSLSDISNGFVGGIISFIYFTKNKPMKDPTVLDLNNSLSMVLKH